MEEQDNSVNYVLPMAMGIGVMAACGIVTFVMVLLAILVF